MDDIFAATEYLQARQQAEVADRVLQTAKARYNPILGALFPEQRPELEEKSWVVADAHDDAQRRADNLGGQLSAETKQIADEVFDQWKKERG